MFSNFVRDHDDGVERIFVSMEERKKKFSRMMW